MAIENAEIEKPAIGCAVKTMAEIVLAPGVETQILAHLRAARFEKADQTAPMVEMTVAEDQRIDRGRIDLHQFEIVHVDVRGEAIIEHVAPRFRAFGRFDMQREAPFAQAKSSMKTRLRRSTPRAGIGASRPLSGARRRSMADYTGLRMVIANRRARRRRARPHSRNDGRCGRRSPSGDRSSPAPRAG